MQQQSRSKAQNADLAQKSTKFSAASAYQTTKQASNEAVSVSDQATETQSEDEEEEV